MNILNYEGFKVKSLAEIVEKQKSLQPGTCMAFGSSFKIPMIVKMQMPNPAPSSSSCDVLNTWKA